MIQTKSPNQKSLLENRAAKAQKIYQALVSNGLELEHVRRFTPESWAHAAMLAGYEEDESGHIISDETCGLVRGLFDRAGQELRKPERLPR